MHLQIEPYTNLYDRREGNMAIACGIIFEVIIILVYLLLFTTDFWQKISPYLAGIISSLTVFAYVQDHRTHKMAHPVICVIILTAVVETLLVLLLRIKELKIPATYLCVAINIMFLMIGTASVIQRHSLVHCVISMLIYFAMAHLILYLSASDNFGDGLLCPMRRTWPMRIIAAVISTAASLILCFDPMMILSEYCMEECTAAQQDKINIYAWLGLGFMIAVNMAYSLISDWWKWNKAVRS